MDKFEVPKSSLMESSSRGFSRRPRARCNGAQPTSCLVDGCRSDLSRDYHRRHKVCEAHSKAPIVTVGGQEKRFCQQCSRFHLLVEFDEGKRSCRKRLDGHNRRRRKPRPESLFLNQARFLSSHQGARYLPFGRPQAYPIACSLPSSACVGIVKADDDPTPKQFMFLKGSSSALVDPSCALANDALSLLSQPLLPNDETRDVGFKNYMVHLDPPRPQSLTPPTLNLRSQVESRGSLSEADRSSISRVVNERGF